MPPWWGNPLLVSHLNRLTVGSSVRTVSEEKDMLRKRNLVALIMAAMLSLGTLGVAFAEDSGSDRIGDAPVPGTTHTVNLDAAH